VRHCRSRGVRAARSLEHGGTGGARAPRAPSCPRRWKQCDGRLEQRGPERGWIHRAGAWSTGAWVAAGCRTADAPAEARRTVALPAAGRRAAGGSNGSGGGTPGKRALSPAAACSRPTTPGTRTSPRRRWIRPGPHASDRPLDRAAHPSDYGNSGTAHYGMPINAVPSSQAAVKVTFDNYPDESDPGPYPFPDPGNARIEGGTPLHAMGTVTSSSCRAAHASSTRATPATIAKRLALRERRQVGSVEVELRPAVQADPGPIGGEFGLAASQALGTPDGSGRDEVRREQPNRERIACDREPARTSSSRTTPGEREAPQRRRGVQPLPGAGRSSTSTDPTGAVRAVPAVRIVAGVAS